MFENVKTCIHLRYLKRNSKSSRSSRSLSLFDDTSIGTNTTILPSDNQSCSLSYESQDNILNEFKENSMFCNKWIKIKYAYTSRMAVNYFVNKIYLLLIKLLDIILKFIIFHHHLFRSVQKQNFKRSISCFMKLTL